MIRRVVIGLMMLAVLALAALELVSARRLTGVERQSPLTESVERDARPPVASELEGGTVVRPILTR